MTYAHEHQQEGVSAVSEVRLVPRAEEHDTGDHSAGAGSVHRCRFIPPHKAEKRQLPELQLREGKMNVPECLHLLAN